MDKEIKVIKKNKIWEMTESLKGHNAISVKRVYKKNEPTSKVERHKERLMVEGYWQNIEIDYNEVFCIDSMNGDNSTTDITSYKIQMAGTSDGC
jgi:Reverse transcriptase (RNA-dependent DNA polymerase)